MKRDVLLEQILYDWYTQQISNNVKITSLMLRSKAEELSTASSEPSGKQFSSGWVEGFKKRYGIKIGDKAKQSSKDDHEDANNELMERILYDWVVHQQVNNASISGHMVRAKAKELSKACSPQGSSGTPQAAKKIHNWMVGWI